MAGFGRRSKPLKAGTAIAEVDGVALTGVADGDLLIYDATAEAFLNTKALDGSYTVSGGFTAATLTASGNASLGGALSVAGNTSLAGTLTVGGTTTLDAASATSLTVSGVSTLTGDTTIIGALAASAADFAQPVTMNLGLTVFGTTALGPFSATSGTLSSSLDVTGPAVLGSNLSVAGDLSVIGTIATGSSFSASSIGASGTLTAGGAATLFSTLSVSGAATMASTLNVTGATAFGTVAGAYSTSDGWGISGALSNAVTGNQDVKLSLRNGDRSTQVGVIGFETGLGLVVRSQTHGGSMTLSVEDSSGNVETGLVITPDAGVALRFANSVTLETVSGGAKTTGAHQITGNLDHDGSNVGFYNTAPAAKQTVTGSRGGNAALASLLTALAAIGLLTDSSSA